MERRLSNSKFVPNNLFELIIQENSLKYAYKVYYTQVYEQIQSERIVHSRY